MFSMVVEIFTEPVSKNAPRVVLEKLKLFPLVAKFVARNSLPATTALAPPVVEKSPDPLLAKKLFVENGTLEKVKVAAAPLAIAPSVGTVEVVVTEPVLKVPEKPAWACGAAMPRPRTARAATLRIIERSMNLVSGKKERVYLTRS